MLKKVRIENYGPFREAELSLEPLTVLVGPNASGKSTILNLLHGLSVGGWDSSGGASFLRRSFRQGSEEGSLSTEIELTSGDSIEWSSADTPHSDFKGSSKDLLPRVVFPHLDTNVLRQPSYVDSEGLLVEDNGYGVPTALANLRLTDNARFEEVMERTKSIVPAFEGVSFRRTRIDRNGHDPVVGEGLVYNMRNASELPPKAMSDGTLFTLGLLTVAAEHSRVFGSLQGGILFLIDEPEQHLHPKALTELVTQLRGLIAGADVQILAASHSPYLVDALHHREVRIVSFLEDGSSTVRELSECPEFDRWKDLMEAGEIWSTVGDESWIR